MSAATIFEIHDTATMAGDVAEPTAHLGFDQFAPPARAGAPPSPTLSPPSTGPGSAV
jgi:hypothetical protein